MTVLEREFELLSPAEVNLRIRSALGRKLVVVGVTVGTDAHTVGIDAILNVKGHAGEKGLEYYRYVLGLLGALATEACVVMDGDEGLFASYSDVRFRAPVLAGDVLEATCTVTAVGWRSRQLSFEARVVCRADPARGPSASAVLGEPIVVVTAAGTVVVPG